jgi:hypothetical protein
VALSPAINSAPVIKVFRDVYVACDAELTAANKTAGGVAVDCVAISWPATRCARSEECA